MICLLGVLRGVPELLRLAVSILGLWLVWAGFARAAEDVDYARDVKPILSERCVACHGALKQAAGLRLDTGADLRQGSDSGPVIDRDQPEESLLLRVVTGAAGFRMPPPDQGAALTEEEIGILKRWIQAGAPSPAGEERQTNPQDYWSYRSPTRPNVPEVVNPDWVRTPIDAFIAARHDQLKLSPSPEASREVWLRRVTFDLIGLPPTPEERRAFLADQSPDAYEKVVEELLGRPQYGERWGRHWMDVWRYSDWYGSRGINEIRYSQRHLWRWRDWIVESLNKDVGYDQMVREMLAGDELAPDDPQVLRATGFLARNWYKFDRNVWMFDTVEQTAQAFLGVTLRCARCHDHKYDPVTQEDYYRFRAFFEPHQVRTDVLSLRDGEEKDATLGMVPKTGVARVFDRDPEVATYLFERGDDRFPRKDNPLSPAVLPALAGRPESVAPVDLPVTAFYPALRPERVAERLQLADEAIIAISKSLEESRFAITTAETALAEAKASTAEGAVPPEPFLKEKFASARPEVWQIVSGDWVHVDGRLQERSTGSFATMVTKANHPRDFRAKAVYRTLQPGTTRSVGFSFDYVDQGNSQDVYTSTGDAVQSVQAFHRHGGQQAYPDAGTKLTALRVGDETTLEWEVRGSQLRLSLNGAEKLIYQIPLARRDGRFAMWVHLGSAEFLSLEVAAILPSLDDLDGAVRQARDLVEEKQARLKVAQLERSELQKRVLAEQAKYLEDDDERFQVLARAASLAQRETTVGKAELTVLLAEQRVARLRTDKPDTSPAKQKAIEAANQELAQAITSREQAASAILNSDGSYQPLGDVFPARSTGRRRALAKWITQPDHPRTARIAVNQIWMRHFGQPLVPSVANFGMNGSQPTHPELLDWLAVELVDSGWRMKRLHRLITLSAVYRQTSREQADSNRSIDSANRGLWRMNAQRMQAELVRDSLLSLAGGLDLTRGGPEIPESEGERVLRRSLYFRNTPNEKMSMLASFDMASPNQCYRRQESVVPQQALALMNSGLTLDQARVVAERLSARLGTAEPAGADPAGAEIGFIASAFETILNRQPTEEEKDLCVKFLVEHTTLLRDPGEPFPAGGSSRRPPSADPAQRARENLVHVLFSHNEFITIR